MSPSDVLVWLNIALTIGGFVTIYVKIVERLTKLETHNTHIMRKLDMHPRAGEQ